MGDRLISCTVAAEMMRAKADMAALEYKLVFEAAAKMFDVLAAARKKSEPLIRRTDDLGSASEFRRATRSKSRWTGRAARS